MKIKSIFLFAIASVFAVIGNLHAASSPWKGTADSTWTNVANWSAAPVPGTGDTATFNGSGNNHTNIDLGTGVTISNILFIATNVAAYTIGAGAAGSQVLTINNGGSIILTNTVASNQLFNAAVVLGTDATAQNYFFTNNSGSLLTFAGGLTGGSGGTAGAKTLNIAGTGNITVTNVIANGGATALSLSKTGTGTNTLSGNNTYDGATMVSAGVLVLSGDNTGATGAVTNSATLQLANTNAVNGSALVLNSGSTLQLRADVDSTFTPTSLALQNASDTLNFDVNSLTGATGKKLTLAGALAFGNSSSQTINVTGDSTYTLGLGAVTLTTGSHTPYFVFAVNAPTAGPAVTIASILSGNYGNYVNMVGGGNVNITGTLGNTSNGSDILFVNGGTTVTLQGPTVKSGSTGDAYKYLVVNGTLVLENSAALTNNGTAATGLSSSQFIIGAVTNNTLAIFSGPPNGVLTATNNSFNAAVYLGGDTNLNGGLSVNAKTTNYVADGDSTFTNSGVFTIGGQNTNGINAYNNPIILGWSANRGKSVKLVSAAGGEVDFTGTILANGSDTTAAVTVGDTAHSGLVKLTGANTYGGGTTVTNGTLLVNNTSGSGTGTNTVTVSTNSTLGGSGKIAGSVTVNNGGNFVPGASAIAAGTVLTISNSLKLNAGSFTTMKVQTGSTNDQAVSTGTVTYGGTLTVTNPGAALVAGDSFKLFTAASYTGTFSSISLPAIDPGLVWTNTLATNGTVAIINATIIPAVVTNLPASNVTVSGATLNGQLISTGGQTPTVTIYYGLTNGGTNAGAWSNSIALGSTPDGNFSNVLAGLSPTTTYYYAAAAVNSAGTAWAAPSQSFTTPAQALAVVTNLPPTNVQGTSATMNGKVVSIGSQTPTVTLYYGLVNGGTNAANWSYSVALGPQAGNFSYTTNGFAYGTTYYFTVSAVNTGGIAWASPSRFFNTPAPAVVTNLPASNVQTTSATLNGQVLSIGSQIPVVTMYYGTTDGGTNAGAWGNSVSLGAQGGNFSYALAALATNTTYYFTASATNPAGLVWAQPSLSFTTTNSVTGIGTMTNSGVSVLTYHNDNARSGANTNETFLTPANVNTNSFGQLFHYTVDGFVTAQPLYVPNLTIPGQGVHDVVFVATENNTVYAFDADGNGGANGGVLWSNNLAPSVSYTLVGEKPDGDMNPSNIGIHGTPVIDPVSGTIYVDVDTVSNAITFPNGVATTNLVFNHLIHALNITTGNEQPYSPVTVAASMASTSSDASGGILTFNPQQHSARPALTLAGGILYVCYGSYQDIKPYHGWLLGFNATNLVLMTNYIYNTNPDLDQGALWMGGDGLVVDANTNLYFEAANGNFDVNTGGRDYGDSFVKLTTTNGLVPADYFTPSNQATMQSQDHDLGSAGDLLLPDEVGSTNHPHLLVGSWKQQGTVYLVDRDNMGKYNGATGNNQELEEFYTATTSGGCFSTPAYWNYNLYYCFCGKASSPCPLFDYTITNALITPTPASQSANLFKGFGGTPSISANGTSNAIVWLLEVGIPPSTAVLYAFSATNLANQLYNSSQLTRDKLPNAAKFAVPTVVNGKVYVGSQFTLTVFGSTTFIATPTISPNGGTYANSTVVTLSDVTAGANIYYTLNGTLPTTNSFLYSSPFVITNTLNVEAVAIKSGSVNSGVAVASFVNTAAPGNGTGLLGQYWTNTTATAFTNAGFATPPTLTVTDAVVNFNWTTNGPYPSVGTNNYTVRWTGAVQAQYNETYTFTTIAADGVRLWVNGQLLVNDWTTHTSPATNSGSITLNSQQLYNIRMDYFQGSGTAVAQLQWSSPSTAQAVVPQPQLYAYTNPPPTVVISSPTNSATNFTAAASVTFAAMADAPYNPISQVDFYTNNALFASVSNSPYAPLYVVTVTGLAAGSYTLNAVAVDGSGLSNSSAPVGITVTNGSGLPYGLTSNAPVAAFLNMPTTFTGALPALLSGTGAFSNTTNRTPANGLIPYVPNTPLWSDSAVKSRYMAVPNNGGVMTPDEQVQFAPTNSWTFPAGTVFVKNFDLVVNQTNASVPLRRLETRLLVRDNNGGVYGVTYKWRPDNSDADLLTSGTNELIAITNATGVWTQTWTYPSPQDCLTCHTPWSGGVLGVNTRQLNGSETYSATGVTDNQLRTLNRLGLFYPAIDEGGISNFDQLSSLTNLSASLEQRVRSYLDANCSQCHTPLNTSGIHAGFDARYDTPLAQQNITNAPAITSLGISDNACVVKSKDIWRSVMYYRINTVDDMNPGGIQMPPLARNLIDTNAVQVLTNWINSLPGTPALAPPAITPNGGSFSPTVSVTLTPPDGTSQLYYTLNGLLPTNTVNPTNFLYAGPVLLTNSATFMANAFETNFNNSIAVSALFTVQPQYFTSAAFLLNGQFQLGVVGVTSNTYVLQASTNLINWIPLSTNLATTNIFNLLDPGASNFPYRFYRTLQQ